MSIFRPPAGMNHHDRMTFYEKRMFICLCIFVVAQLVGVGAAIANAIVN